MKKVLNFIAAAVLGIAMLSCAKEQVRNADSADPDEKTEAGKIAKVFTAGFERTRGDIESGNLRWAVNDKVAVYDDVNPSTANEFTVTEVNGLNVTFNGTVSAGATSFKAVYPFAAASENLTGDLLSVVIPSSQEIPSGETVDPSAIVSVAATTTSSFSFKNVFSLAKFTITQDNVSEVRFDAAVGECSPSAATGILSEAGTFAHVTVTPAGGGNFAAGTYYAAVVPCTRSGMVVCSKVGAVFRWKHDDSTTGVEFPRNGGIDFQNVDTGNILLAKWRFTKELKTDFEAAWRDTTTASGYGKRDGIYANEAGLARIRFRSAGSTSQTRGIASATGFPQVNSVQKNDRWVFFITPSANIASGSKIHIKFYTNISSSGDKTWRRAINNGSAWRYFDSDGNPTLADTSSDVLVTTPTDGSYTLIEGTITLAAELPAGTEKEFFRLFKYGGETGYTRLCDNASDGFDIGPYIEIVP